jgi:hypothetical protein
MTEQRNQIVPTILSETDSGRMRQIITPLPKVAERQLQKKSASASNSRRASSAEMSDEAMYVTCISPGLTSGSSIVGARRASSARSDYSWPHQQIAPQVASYDISMPRLTSSLSFDTTSVPGYNPSVSQTLLGPIPFQEFSFGSMDQSGPNLSSVGSSPSLPNVEETQLLDFFLREIPKLLPFTELFSTAGSEIWAMSLTHAPLTQSILALSAGISQQSTGMPSATVYTYVEKALSRIQESLAMEAVDEGLIAAVFLLAFQSILTGDHKSARRHLQGMLQIFQIYQARGSCQTTRNAEHFPIVMLIYRMAIRMECYVSFYNSGQGPPVFPPLSQSMETTHTPWISEVIDKTIPNNVEWALASFALDDLMNRAGHFYHQFADGNNETKVFHFQQLVEEHKSWTRRPIVHQAILTSIPPSAKSTINPHLMQAPKSGTFLHYPPAIICDSRLGCLLLRHLTIGIYISLISDTRPGPISSERVQFAIDICRYFVALYVDRPGSVKTLSARASANCMALVAAGLVFRPDTYPNEFDFCVRTLSNIANNTGFVALFEVIEVLKGIWKDKEKNWTRAFEMKILASPTLPRWEGADWSLAGGYPEVEQHFGL